MSTILTHLVPKCIYKLNTTKTTKTQSKFKVFYKIQSQILEMGIPDNQTY